MEQHMVEPRRRGRGRRNVDLPSAAPVVVPIKLYIIKVTCSDCTALLANSSATPNATSSADRAMRHAASEKGWKVRMLISGHYLYTCPSCQKTPQGDST